LPPGYLAVRDRFYVGGVWYARRPGGFIVVGPPIGVFVPVLPAFYTTVWIGGFPYYYANDTYYEWSDVQRSYEVVEPPVGAEEVAPDGAPPPDGEGAPPPGAAMPPPGAGMPPPGAPSASGPYIYPKNGQSDAQQAQDKYECHRWAVSQSGFDPTLAGGGVAPGQNGAGRADYQRALGACLEGRGYTVR